MKWLYRYTLCTAKTHSVTSLHIPFFPQHKSVKSTAILHPFFKGKSLYQLLMFLLWKDLPHYNADIKCQPLVWKYRWLTIKQLNCRSIDSLPSVKFNHFCFIKSLLLCHLPFWSISWYYFFNDSHSYFTKPTWILLPWQQENILCTSWRLKTPELNSASLNI